MNGRWLSGVLACLCGAVLCACVSPTSHEEITAAFDAGVKAYDAGDYKTAYAKWKSIEEVDLAAMRNLALLLRKGQGVKKNPKAAREMMLVAAEDGLVTAQADLGDMLLKGEAGKPDPAAAAPWLEQASQAGHPRAAFELGQLYEQGSGVKKDIERARKLYRQAADAGVKEAEEALKTLPPAPPSPAAAPPRSAVPTQTAAALGH
jgi:uncharacterized protein